MNWCLETELHHGAAEWDVLREGIMWKFSFEYGFKIIDEAPQEVKASIFKILQEPLELIQPDWSTQLRHALECYNVVVEGEDEHLRNINIPKNRGPPQGRGTVDRESRHHCAIEN